MEDDTDPIVPPGTNHTRRETVVKESDPYRNIWDDPRIYKDEDLAKSGSLFMPTYLEISQRSMGTSRHYLWKARKLNSQGQYKAAKRNFQEALSHRRIAKGLFQKHQEVLAKSH